VVVRSLRRHSIGVRLVVHATLAVWTGAIVTLSIALLIVVHISSVVRAGIVWVAVWVLSARLSLGLGRMCLLGLSRLNSLLSLGWWVWSSVPAGLSFTNCCVSRLSLLRGGLGEWRGSISRWCIVSAESPLLGGWALLLSLSALLLTVLAVVVLVSMTLLVCCVVLRVLARSRGESTSLLLCLCLGLLAWIAFILALSRRCLLAERIVWLLAKGRLLLSARLSITSVLCVLVTSLRTLLGHRLSSR